MVTAADSDTLKRIYPTDATPQKPMRTDSGNAHRPLSAAARFSAAIAAPHCPLRVLPSRADRLVNAAFGQARSGIACRTANIRGARQDLPYDDPPQTAEQRRAWLDLQHKPAQSRAQATQQAPAQTRPEPAL